MLAQLNTTECECEGPAYLAPDSRSSKRAGGSHCSDANPCTNANQDQHSDNYPI